MGVGVENWELLLCFSFESLNKKIIHHVRSTKDLSDLPICLPNKKNQKYSSLWLIFLIQFCSLMQYIIHYCVV